LDIVGLEDKRLLHDSLSIILAKTPEEKETFDICFDRFFSFKQFEARPDFREYSLASASTGEGFQFGGEQEADSGGERRKKRRRRNQAHHNSRLGHLLLEGDQTELSVAMARAATEVRLDRMKTLRERSLYARRILVHMGLNQLDAEIERLDHQEDESSRYTAAMLADARNYLTEQVRDFVEEQYLLMVDGSGDRFLREAVTQTRLTNMQVYYFDHIREAVRKLAHQLAKRHNRKRKIYNRGQLDIRKTMRRNMGYDNTPYEIQWKQIKVEKPKVFVICDVSGSVRNVARFLLTFLYSLNEVLPKVRAFVFSNELGEVTDMFKRYPLDDAIELSMNDYGKGSTDYGNAFKTFKELCLNDVDNRSTVIILGDSRNNYFDTGAEHLKEISRKCRQVMWLNPESRQMWHEGDAEMKAFLPHVHYAEVCNSLKDLERLVSRILRSAR
ncbi:MAG: VWA domain-containing protein, partial [Pseudomonadales bacterium]|nr:VWA domain-containing protein [Pseudomonadales bacterium]